MKRRTAFTLVELLVVMAIIGILAGILFPALGGIRKKARRTQSHSLVTQVEEAWTIHFNDFRSFPDPTEFDPAGTARTDVSFSMTPYNIAMLNWRCKRPTDYEGNNKAWRTAFKEAVKDACGGKKKVNKPHKLKVDGVEISISDHYFEIDPVQWFVGVANTWGARAAQKGFSESEGDPATTAEEFAKYCQDHPDPLVQVMLDTDGDGKIKVEPPVPDTGVSTVNKIAIAWVNSESEKDKPIVSW